MGASVAAKSASASHILVKDEAKILEIKAEIEAGTTDFGEAAKKHSTCPSGKSGGSLGSFGPGPMVPEFDKVVFSGEIKTVLGPVKTQFGHHLIWIESREEYRSCRNLQCCNAFFLQFVVRTY